MFLALGIQHAIRMRRSVKFGMSSFTIFFHIVLLRARFSRKKIIERMMCVLIFSATFVWNVSHSKNNWAREDQKCVLVFQ